MSIQQTIDQLSTQVQMSQDGRQAVMDYEDFMENSIIRALNNDKPKEGQVRIPLPANYTITVTAMTNAMYYQYFNVASEGSGVTFTGQGESNKPMVYTDGDQTYTAKTFKSSTSQRSMALQFWFRQRNDDQQIKSFPLVGQPEWTAIGKNTIQVRIWTEDRADQDNNDTICLITMALTR